MAKYQPKYTPEELKKVKAENLRRNVEKARANGYTQKNPDREKAIQEGRKTYISNKPCKDCGSSERYVSNYACAPCLIKKGLEKLNNEELMKPYRTKEKKQKYCEKNRERVNGIKRKYSHTERGRAVNCEKQRRRIARVKQGIPIDITPEELSQIQKIYEEAQHLTKNTGVRHVVDHIIPLIDGGPHHPDNLQVITYEEHLLKTAQENSRRFSK